MVAVPLIPEARTACSVSGLVLVANLAADRPPASPPLPPASPSLPKAIRLRSSRSQGGWRAPGQGRRAGRPAVRSCHCGGYAGQVLGEGLPGSRPGRGSGTAWPRCAAPPGGPAQPGGVGPRSELTGSKRLEDRFSTQEGCSFDLLTRPRNGHQLHGNCGRASQRALTTTQVCSVCQIKRGQDDELQQAAPRWRAHLVQDGQKAGQRFGQKALCQTSADAVALVQRPPGLQTRTHDLDKPTGPCSSHGSRGWSTTIQPT